VDKFGTHSKGNLSDVFQSPQAPEVIKKPNESRSEIGRTSQSVEPQQVEDQSAHRCSGRTGSQAILPAIQSGDGCVPEICQGM